jgi:hypothetical protein
MFLGTGEVSVATRCKHRSRMGQELLLVSAVAVRMRTALLGLVADSCDVAALRQHGTAADTDRLQLDAHVTASVRRARAVVLLALGDGDDGRRQVQRPAACATA